MNNLNELTEALNNVSADKISKLIGKVETSSGGCISKIDVMQLKFSALGYNHMNRSDASSIPTLRKMQGETITRTENIIINNINSFTSCDNDFVFYKNNSVISAEAIYNNNNHIIDFEYAIIK